MNAPDVERTGVVAQVRIALAPRNRLAALVGALLGAIVPVGTFMLAHHEIGRIDRFNPLMLLVAAGLVYSATTVYQWGRAAFRSAPKAIAFAVLIEGIMTFSAQPWLATTALVYLIAVNAIATGCVLAQEPGAAAPRKSSRAKPRLKAVA